MMNIAIVDDNPQDALLLRRLVEKTLADRGQTCQFHLYQDGLSFIRSDVSFDVAFLDIHMNGLDGLEVARFLRRLSSQTELVFVTNMAQMAIRGYEVDAAAFIIKPADLPAINRVICKLLGRIQARNGHIITLHTAEGAVTLQTGQITCVEVYGHELIYHTHDRDYRVRGQLVKAAEELDTRQFLLCSRSYLVNLNHVDKVEQDQLIIGEHVIPISKVHRREVRERFVAFLGDKL